MKPMPFQIEDIEYVEDWFDGRGLFAWDAGLGKTLAALWFTWRQDDALPALVIVPAAVKWQWAREIKRIMGLDAMVLEGQLGSEIPESVDIVVVNYDILSKPDSRKRKGKRVPVPGESWTYHIKRWNPATIIMDEVQHTANVDAKRTQACMEICKGRRYVLGLSATPLLNRPIEMWPALNMIRPDVFESRLKYARRYCEPRLDPSGKWDYRGISNEAELHNLLLDSCMVRRRKVDVLEQFPPKVRNVVTLPLKDPLQYNEASTDFMYWLRKKDAKKASQIVRSGNQALFKVGELLRLAAKLKMRFVNQWLTEFLKGTDEKVVVFANHKKAIASIRKNVPFKSVVVDGSVRGRSRLQAVDRFVTDNKVRLCIGNTRAMGTGTDGLQKAARHVVFAELPWQPGLVQQSEDRLWRIGTTEKVWVWFLVAAYTIEERLCEVLQQKQGGLSAILDGGRVKGDLDILDQLVFELGR